MMTKQLKELLGFFGYNLLKRHLRNVKIQIDTEKRLVTITKTDFGVGPCPPLENERKFQISFDEIEQLVNE